jgi:uncharacterized damage-inducible protein DinB
MEDPKQTLIASLQAGRDAMLWKLDGLSEYDARRPLTPTGTNLLGLVKHLASVELGYFGETFGRPSDISLAWYDDPDGDPNADLYATSRETRQELVDLYQAAWAHAADTFAALDLDAEGTVPWWSEDRNPVTLHQILVHVVAETHRHAGHADILRETIDGQAGRRPDDPSLDGDYDFAAYRDRVEEAAKAAAERSD